MAVCLRQALPVWSGRPCTLGMSCLSLCSPGLQVCVLRPAGESARNIPSVVPVQTWLSAEEPRPGPPFLPPPVSVQRHFVFLILGLGSLSTLSRGVGWGWIMPCVPLICCEKSRGLAPLPLGFRDCVVCAGVGREGAPEPCHRAPPTCPFSCPLSHLSPFPHSLLCFPLAHII